MTETATSADVLEAVTSALEELEPYFGFVLRIIGIVLMVNVFSNLLTGIVGYGCSFDLIGSLFEWLGDKIVDCLKFLFGYEFIEKIGLAREGIDYVECGTQDCSVCPFNDKCGERRVQFDE